MTRRSRRGAGHPRRAESLRRVCRRTRTHRLALVMSVVLAVVLVAVVMVPVAVAVVETLEHTGLPQTIHHLSVDSEITPPPRTRADSNTTLSD